MIEINNVRDGLLAGRADFHHGLLVRGLFERGEGNKPTVALGARAAGQRDREYEIERRDLPFPAGAAAFHGDAKRCQQVLG